MLSGLLTVPRMVGNDRFAQEPLVEVRVQLGCGDAFVPQHILHRAQIGAAFDQVRCKGMP